MIATNLIKIKLGNVHCFSFKGKAATIMLSCIASDWGLFKMITTI